MCMPNNNEHGDVFLHMRIYEKCSSHNNKAIKQHSNQIPSVIITLQTNNMTKNNEHGDVFLHMRIYEVFIPQ